MPTVPLSYLIDENEILGEEGVRLRDQAINALEALQEYIDKRLLERTVIECVVSINVPPAEEPGK